MILLSNEIVYCDKILSEVSEQFVDWLNSELNERRWTQSDLARAAGLGRGTVSNIVINLRKPGPEFCQAIAHALELPEEFVFRKAGLLSTPAGYDETYEEWRAVLHELTENNRDELLHFARLRLERQRKEAWSERFRQLNQDQLKELYQFMDRLGWSQPDASTGSPPPRKSK